MFNLFFKRKKGLKVALSEVINSLENDIVKYNWKEQSSCNCGLIVQSLLNLDLMRVSKYFHDERKKTSLCYDDKETFTWKAVLKERCTATGLPMRGIFKALLDHGFRPEDIAHVEYLTNKGILAGTTIDTTQEKYFSRKENLIKYLKSWVNILNEENIEISSTENKEELEAQLLREVESERYEDAIKTKNKIASLLDK